MQLQLLMQLLMRLVIRLLLQPLGIYKFVISIKLL